MRLVVEARRQRPAGGKAGERKPVDRRFRAAGEHDLGVAIGDEPRRVADGVRAGRAGGHDGVVRAFEPVLDRDVARGEVDDPARDEERRDAPRALLVERDRGVIDAADAADAGADENAGGILLVGGLRLPRRVLQRLGRGGHRVDDEGIDLALLLRLHPLVGIEAAVGAVAARDLAGDRQARSAVSKLSIFAPPLSPARSRCQLASTPQPSGETIPTPVTTTRRIEQP